jgi:serine protease Do
MNRSAARLATAIGAVAAVLVLGGTTPTPAQVVVRNGPQDGFVLLELGAVMVPDGDGEGAKVEHAFEPERRPAAYRDIDIAAGDLVLAINGKRVHDAKELEAVFAAVPVGQQVELGVERPGKIAPVRRIVKFAKADPATMPKPQMRMLRIEPEPGTDIDAMPALGVVVKQKEAAGSPIEVAAVLPNGEGIFRQGDRLVELDGKPVTRLADFGQRWDAIAVGAKVTLVLENGGKRRTETLTRREAPAGQRVIRH